MAGMADPLAANVAREAHIPQALNRLDETLGQLEKGISVLDERLQPVSSRPSTVAQDMAIAKNDLCDGDEPASMGVRIDELSGRVQRFVAQVGEMQRRLEI